MSREAPLGVFDSGVGGLSVLAEVRRELPHEDVLYLADTAHLPYGERSDDDLRDLTLRAVTALRARGAKAVVVACNTASAFGLSHVRAAYPELPILGLVPAVKPAVQATRSGVVGVLATPGTLRGTLLSGVIHDFADPAGVRVMKAVSTELVPLVEAGEAGGARTRAVLREVLTPLAEAGADQLVLGCTHYPFLAPTIRAEFGEAFALLDSGAAVARHTRRVLEGAGLLAGRTQGAQVRYFVTGDPQRAAPVMAALLAATGQSGHNEAPFPSSDPLPGAAPAPLPRIEPIQT